MAEATRRPSRWRVFAPDTLWLGVAELVLWGVIYSRGQHWSWLVALTAGPSTGCSGC
jgi:hypothetical protein